MANAIKGQIDFKNKQKLQLNLKQYQVNDVLKKMCYMFESVYIGDSDIFFKDVLCEGFEDISVINMHEIIYDVVIPEIILNMKKCSSRLIKNGLVIKYEKSDNALIFKNDVRDAFKNDILDKAYGGINMCREILDELNYQKFESRYIAEENIYVNKIKFNS